MKLLVYREEEGGAWNAIAGKNDQETQELFQRIVETTVLRYQSGDKIIKVVPQEYGIFVPLQADKKHEK